MSYPDQTVQSPTTLGNWILLIAQAVDSYGVDSNVLFRDAGIDLTDIKNNQTRFPTALLAQAWQNAVQKTQDPYIAIRAIPTL